MKVVKKRLSLIKLASLVHKPKIQWLFKDKSLKKLLSRKQKELTKNNIKKSMIIIDLMKKYIFYLNGVLGFWGDRKSVV
jgi:hypothetical protein